MLDLSNSQTVFHPFERYLGPLYPAGYLALVSDLWDALDTLSSTLYFVLSLSHLLSSILFSVSSTSFLFISLILSFCSFCLSSLYFLPATASAFHSLLQHSFLFSSLTLLIRHLVSSANSLLASHSTSTCTIIPTHLVFFQQYFQQFSNTNIQLLTSIRTLIDTQHLQSFCHESLLHIIITSSRPRRVRHHSQTTFQESKKRVRITG